METVSSGIDGGRHHTIAAAIGDELRRQALSGAVRIDVDAMASAVEYAIEDGDETGSGVDDDAMRTDELNSSNDG